MDAAVGHQALERERDEAALPGARPEDVEITVTGNTLTIAASTAIAAGINAIRKEESDKGVLSQLDYPSQLWMEKEIKSVANVTRQDVREFLALAAEIPLLPEVQEYPLAEANLARIVVRMRSVRCWNSPASARSPARRTSHRLRSPPRPR